MHCYEPNALSGLELAITSLIIPMAMSIFFGGTYLLDLSIGLLNRKLGWKIPRI